MSQDISNENAIGLAAQSLVSIKASQAASKFDAHHAPQRDLMDTCVHCGFCLPACPTYQLWGDEMDSPRGRIWLMRKASQGEAELDATFQKHMDQCLGCMSCMTACPSGVQYNMLIEDTRGQVERNTTRSLGDRLFRKMLFETFPHPTRLRILGLPLALYQRSGLQRLVRASGFLKLLPKRLAAMEQLLPEVPLNPFHAMPSRVAAHGQPRGRVAMLTGCVQDAFFPDVNDATTRVLSAAGYEVIVPEHQGCCGALMVHSGLEREAAEFAKKLIATLETARAEIIVINAAGCGSTMKEYGHLLRDDPMWAARAAEFSAKCKDLSEVLDGLDQALPFRRLPVKVAYHDACHLRHAQGVYAQPRSLLASIPSLEVAEIADSYLCCGSAGVYNLLHPATAEELGDRKAENVLATGAEALVSANPGCLLQLRSALERRGQRLPMFHTVQVLDAALRGISREEFFQSKRKAYPAL